MMFRGSRFRYKIKKEIVKIENVIVYIIFILLYFNIVCISAHIDIVPI